MKEVVDLRSIIGFFFLLVGIFLLIGSFIMHAADDKSELVNRWCGIFYTAFGIFMLILWITGKKPAQEE